MEIRRIIPFVAAGGNGKEKSVHQTWNILLERASMN